MEFTTIGCSDALQYAQTYLLESGWEKNEQAKTVLLPVPSFTNEGTIKGGGTLEGISKDSLIIGGKLDSLLQSGYRTLDLLMHPLYLSENAAITAYCALQVAAEKLSVTFQDCPILVIGWGRIGKCLVRLLRLLGAKVTVAARKEPDRALAEALGYAVTDLGEGFDPSPFRVIFNTADGPVLPSTKQVLCRKDCLKIDLASTKGIEGQDVIWARGLPSALAPESSGALIAKILLKEVGL